MKLGHDQGRLRRWTPMDDDGPRDSLFRSFDWFHPLIFCYRWGESTLLVIPTMDRASNLPLRFPLAAALVPF